MHSAPSGWSRRRDDEADREWAPVRGRGVLLINLGTPDDLSVPSVRRYLAEFLSDPAVIRLPVGLGWLNRPLGGAIAGLRASRTVEAYRRIWTEQGSPLRTITEEQAIALEEALPRGWRVFHAMRYGRPSIRETLGRMAACGVDEVVVVPMYPQYSGTTTGTALRQVYEYLKHHGHSLHVTMRTAWFDDHGYIKAQTELIERFSHSHNLTAADTFLVFSTHGLPVSYVRRGDPYPAQVTRTVGLVGQRLGWPADRMTLAYQSRFGPVEWLGPHTETVLTALARAGERRVLVCPVGFTTDCLETLEEIDVRYGALLHERGVKLYRCPALNTFGPFVSAVKHLVLRGPRPMACQARVVRGVEPMRVSQVDASDDRGLDSFVMIGMSTRGRLGTGRGPALIHTHGDGLRRVKRSQVEMPALLAAIQRETDVREAWVWNTCHRFELYGWLGGAPGIDPFRASAVEEVRRHLFGNEAPEGKINVLRGPDAWHHLLRTAAGLNSGLPGERDILEQLRGAGRLADRAGTAGTLTRHLLDRVNRIEHDLRIETAWGRFNPDYCHVAVTRVAASTGLDLSACQAVVIGGSTTSAGVLTMLAERLNVPARQLTLLYRGHKGGGQLKLLRRAIGQGRRIRVQSYGERRVIDTIAGTDVVFFGVDSEEPVLDAESIRACRDFVTRPLTIFDFNMFGSTRGMERMPGVTLHRLDRLDAEVAAFADEMIAQEEFTAAVDEAERFILERGLGADARGRDAVRTPNTAFGRGQRPRMANVEWRMRENEPVVSRSSDPGSRRT